MLAYPLQDLNSTACASTEVSEKIIFASVSSFRFLKRLSLEMPLTTTERTRNNVTAA